MKYDHYETDHRTISAIICFVSLAVCILVLACCLQMAQEYSKVSRDVLQRIDRCEKLLEPLAYYEERGFFKFK
jgi:hypothetical protein